MRLTLFKNMATGRLEVRAYEHRDGKIKALKNGELVELESEYSEIPVAMSLPFNTEVDNGLEDPSYKALLKQKHDDKENHIQNLNELLIRVMK